MDAFQKLEEQGVSESVSVVQGETKTCHKSTRSIFACYIYHKEYRSENHKNWSVATGPHCTDK